MKDKYIPLLISQLFLMSAFIVGNWIEWAILLTFSIAWSIVYFGWEWKDFREKRKKEEKKK